MTDRERAPRESRGEMFYEDEDGRPSDRDIHEPILAQGDDPAMIENSIERCRKAGLTDEDIKLLFDVA